MVKFCKKVPRSPLIFVLVVLEQSTLNSRDNLSVCKAVAVLCFRSPQANQFHLTPYTLSRFLPSFVCTSLQYFFDS
jgi:hypothetical protein